MVIVNYDGNFLNAKTCKDADIYEIKNEGSWAEITFQGTKKNVLNIKVENSGKEYIWSPTVTQGKTASTAWGNDTAKWIGKKFQVFKINDQMVIKAL